MSQSLGSNIIIGMVEAGGGHKSPAEAIEEALGASIPSSYTISVLDFIREVGAVKTDEKHKNGWNSSLGTPERTRFFYSIMDTWGVPTRAILSLICIPYFRKALAYLKKHPPKVFIATHFLAAAGALFARRWCRRLNYPVIVYATDPNDINSLWTWKGIDLLIVSSERAKKRAVKRGVEPARIRIFGYPVRSSFFDFPKSRKQIGLELGIDNDNLTLLISGGGQGLGKLKELIDDLIREDLPMNLVVVCGKNRELLQSLEEMHPDKLENTLLLPLGFVSNMDELIHLSDVVSVKAGAASTYEALFLNKPVIFYEYAAQNERANIHFVVKNRIGWYADSSEHLCTILRHLIQDEEELLAAIGARIKRLGLHNGAPEIAEHIKTHYLPGAAADVYDGDGVLKEVSAN